MRNTGWQEGVDRLREVRQALLLRPATELSTAESLMEQLQDAVRHQNEPCPPEQALLIQQLSREIRALAEHGAQMAQGWRDALESGSAGTYGPGGAPVSDLFQTTRIQRVG